MRYTHYTYKCNALPIDVLLHNAHRHLLHSTIYSPLCWAKNSTRCWWYLWTLPCIIIMLYLKYTKPRSFVFSSQKATYVDVVLFILVSYNLSHELQHFLMSCLRVLVSPYKQLDNGDMKCSIGRIIITLLKNACI